jgi:hypothetical protein
MNILCGKRTGNGKARSTRTIIVLRLAPQSLTGKIGNLTKATDHCRKKKRFKTYSDAQQSAKHYMEDIFTLNKMESYYCVRHRCYHIGHSNWKKNIITKPG